MFARPSDIIIDPSGSVGIGTGTPKDALDISGTVKMAGTGAEACVSGTVGTFRFNPINGVPQILVMAGRLGPSQLPQTRCFVIPSGRHGDCWVSAARMGRAPLSRCYGFAKWRAALAGNDLQPGRGVMALVLRPTNEMADGALKGWQDIARAAKGLLFRNQPGGG